MLYKKLKRKYKNILFNTKKIQKKQKQNLYSIYNNFFINKMANSLKKEGLKSLNKKILELSYIKKYIFFFQSNKNTNITKCYKKNKNYNIPKKLNIYLKTKYKKKINISNINHKKKIRIKKIAYLYKLDFKDYIRKHVNDKIKIIFYYNNKFKLNNNLLLNRIYNKNKLFKNKSYTALINIFIYSYLCTYILNNIIIQKIKNKRIHINKQQRPPIIYIKMIFKLSKTKTKKCNYVKYIFESHKRLFKKLNIELLINKSIFENKPINLIDLIRRGTTTYKIPFLIKRQSAQLNLMLKWIVYTILFNISKIDKSIVKFRKEILDIIFKRSKIFILLKKLSIDCKNNKMYKHYKWW